MLARDELTGFLKAVCRYYSDFLETDFHTSRAPSRKIQLKNPKGQLLAFDLAAYPDIGRSTLQSFLDRFESALPVIARADSQKAIGEDISLIERPSIYRRALELYKNLELHDKHSAYLYLFPFEFDGNAYPLIYVPVDLDLSDTQDEISLSPAPVMYINVQALRFMAAALSERLNRQWSIDVPDRQLYLASLGSSELVKEVQRLVNVITDFAEGPSINPRRFGEESRADIISVRNSIYLAIAPQGDEALVSDYEDLLMRLQRNPDDPSVLGMMEVIESFLFQNPQSVQQRVEDELASESMSTRISYASPIPLNNEQLMIAKALRLPECNRIVIEGPPGTGKSHTIAGLVFEALQDRKSVLLVSDKKEALDVVEDKINSVLDLSKLDDSFQNPILRLGTKNNNFSKIFYEGNLVKIRARQQALRTRAKSIDSTVRRLQGEIATSAQEQVSARMELHSDKAAIACSFELQQPSIVRLLEKDEMASHGPKAIVNLVCTATKLKNEMGGAFSAVPLSNFKHFDEMIALANDAKRGLAVLAGLSTIPNSRFIADVSQSNLKFLEDLPGRILALKAPITGYLFKGKALESLTHELLQRFPSSGSSPLKLRLEEIARDAGTFRKAAEQQSLLDPIKVNCFDIIRRSRIEELLTAMKSFQAAYNDYRIAFQLIPSVAANLGFSLYDARQLLEHPLPIDSNTALSLAEFSQTSSEIAASSLRVKPGSYIRQRQEIEKNLTLEMSSLLDQSVMRYSDDHKADAVTVRKLIRERKQIPKSLLPAVATAFPCIIIGIRELGSYIPFEYGLFDIVIIDEASQVSIAQALPAILRAKKTVVLGDPKQFSNVKAAFAGSALNAAAFSRVRSALSDALVATDRDTSRHLVDKAGVFNIKTSVLEFTRYLANYTGFLRKHFRGYHELIAYSNEQFYKNMLQVMKIRWKPLSEIIDFVVVESSESLGVISDSNSNIVEAEYILAQLDGLVESGFKGSVAVITPFTDQQGLIMSKVLASSNSRAFRKDLRLKVMTFDTCQGEERDVVYYSMVERAGENKLRYIFPASIADNDEEDGDLRRQRLNVGLSRAKESVRFVISKPVSDFVGEIGNALRVFERQLAKPDFAVLHSLTDSRSPKETEILQAISQTSFYRENEERFEIQPQFPIGELIRQLDPFADVPKYVSDFLLIYRDEDGRSQRVIVEYDGIESHFTEPELVTKDTYDQLRCEGDVERMRTIESYGYPIISLNKFVLGRQPVAVIDGLLRHVFQKKNSDFDDRIGPILRRHAPAQRRVCSRCGIERPIEAFFSEKLLSGTGRVCAVCDPKRGLDDANSYLRPIDVEERRGYDPRDSKLVSSKDRGSYQRANPEEVGREFYLGLMPTPTDITMFLTELARQSGLPQSREDAFRRTRRELLGRNWLRAEQKRMFQDAFDGAVRWLYTGDSLNSKYGEQP
jgi:hypothetical protein